MSDYFSLQY